MQGYRLARGKYAAIRLVHGRLPSKVLDLHLERNGEELQLWNPASGQWLPTPQEQVQQLQTEVEVSEQQQRQLQARVDALEQQQRGRRRSRSSSYSTG